MDNIANDNHPWGKPTIPQTAVEILGLLSDLRARHWLFRGQSRDHGTLYPTIDRSMGLDKITDRTRKIAIERQNIELFRRIARHFAPGEKTAIKTDIGTLMVLQHYGVPTRLLDWTFSPFIALYFVVSENEDMNGEIWGFNEKLYESKGAMQWGIYPETLINNQFDNNLTTAFDVENQHNWFVCQFYYPTFSRITAQEGCFSFTPQFNTDHAVSISNLLEDKKQYHRFIIKRELKLELRTCLKEYYGIWRGILFPDTAGAAETVCKVLKSSIN